MRLAVVGPLGVQGPSDQATLGPHTWAAGPGKGAMGIANLSALRSSVGPQGSVRALGNLWLPSPHSGHTYWHPYSKLASRNFRSDVPSTTSPRPPISRFSPQGKSCLLRDLQAPAWLSAVPGMDLRHPPRHRPPPGGHSPRCPLPHTALSGLTGPVQAC